MGWVTLRHERGGTGWKPPGPLFLAISESLSTVSRENDQPLRHRNHPLPDGHRRDDVIDEVRRRLGHVAAVAGRADAAARERETCPAVLSRVALFDLHSMRHPPPPPGQELP